MKILRQKGKKYQKVVTQKQKLFGTFLPFCFSNCKVSISVQVLMCERKISAHSYIPPNDPKLIECAPIIATVCHSF